MAVKDKLTLERLQRIEQAAAECRSVIADRLGELGFILDRDVDMPLAATVFTGGPVECKPNLEDDGDRLAGMLIWSENGATIHYEEYDPPVRQRFSIAHELGHFCLHADGSHRIHHRCSSSSVSPEEALQFPAEAPTLPSEESNLEVVDIEQEADAFAGAFLLPLEDIQSAREQYGNCDAFLAHLFHVSEPTIRRRFRVLAVLEAGIQEVSFMESA